MIKVLQDWLYRYFSDEQAVVLGVLLALGFAVVLTLGGMLAPVLIGLVLAFLMQGLVNGLERLKLPQPLAGIEIMSALAAPAREGSATTQKGFHV